MKYDVIIIGAGAAGLLAMRQLVDKGRKVCLLEAASFPGGRIRTLKDEGFSEPAESGAEFIHAHLPLTTSLLKEAGITYIPVGGDMITVNNGQWITEDKPDENWNAFMKQLNKQAEDLTVQEFLVKHFSSPEFTELRGAVQRFAEGFDLADITKGSVLSLKKGWNSLEKTQYRIPGGYDCLIDSMVGHCLLPDSIIEYNCFVHKVEYKQDLVKVHTTNGIEYKASKLIITASLGMLQSGEIVFDPPLSAHQTAINEIGFGSVIKFLFEFREPFWNKLHSNTGFILTDEEIPTWWTQLPAETNLLTGWLGGPKAVAYAAENQMILLNTAIESLSNIFKLPASEINRELLHHMIICWSNDDLARGGYSYNTLHSEKAKKILSEPVYDTIYFAGEAMFTGESQGTVEAALGSGKEVAEKIINAG